MTTAGAIALRSLVQVTTACQIAEGRGPVSSLPSRNPCRLSVPPFRRDSEARLRRRWEWARRPRSTGARCSGRPPVARRGGFANPARRRLRWPAYAARSDSCTAMKRSVVTLRREARRSTAIDCAIPRRGLGLRNNRAVPIARRDVLTRDAGDQIGPKLSHLDVVKTGSQTLLADGARTHELKHCRATR